MVVATSGLIRDLNQDQIAAVMAHEIGHIAQYGSVKVLIPPSPP
jgi:Zn-dependent protease with chaperone function